MNTINTHYLKKIFFATDEGDSESFLLLEVLLIRLFNGTKCKFYVFTASNSPESPARSPPPRYVDGMLALCKSCGYTGFDFSRCQRLTSLIYLRPLLTNRQSEVWKHTLLLLIGQSINQGWLVSFSFCLILSKCFC